MIAENRVDPEGGQTREYPLGRRPTLRGGALVSTIVTGTPKVRNHTWSPKPLFSLAFPTKMGSPLRLDRQPIAERTAVQRAHRTRWFRASAAASSA